MHPPEQVQPAPLPEYVFRMIEMLKQAIRDKQNYHIASAGGVAGSMRSNSQQINSQEDQEDLVSLHSKMKMMRTKLKKNYKDLN